MCVYLEVRVYVRVRACMCARARRRVCVWAVYTILAKRTVVLNATNNYVSNSPPKPCLCAIFVVMWPYSRFKITLLSHQRCSWRDVKSQELTSFDTWFGSSISLCKDRFTDRDLLCSIIFFFKKPCCREGKKRQKIKETLSSRTGSRFVLVFVFVPRNGVKETALLD